LNYPREPVSPPAGSAPEQPASPAPAVLFCKKQGGFPRKRFAVEGRALNRRNNATFCRCGKLSFRCDSSLFKRADEQNRLARSRVHKRFTDSVIAGERS
jgi:hypothetical protein